MPHLILEYSGNVDFPASSSDLFSKIHKILAEVGGIKIENCKSRSRVATDFLVGSGDGLNGFIHLDIRFLEGRSPEVRQQIGETLLNSLLHAFKDSIEELELQITIEIQDVERTRYFKHPFGTLISG